MSERAQNDASYKVRVSVQGSLDHDSDWFEPYITELRISIDQELWSETDQEVTHREVGRGEGFILHLGLAVNDRVSILEAADAHSAEAEEYCSAVITPGNDWQAVVNRHFGGEVLEWR
jgi:hypothetical protein